MSNKNTHTKAFDTQGGGKGFKNESSRQILVITIFAVIIVILALFATLIIGKMAGELKNSTTPPALDGYEQKYMDAGDVKIGKLLLINGDYKYTFPSDMSDMINVKLYQKNSQNDAFTSIGGKFTYSLSTDRIYLTQQTLDAFNQMMLDYCKTFDDTASANANANSASNIQIAWGGYNPQNTDEYAQDMKGYSDFYDHGLGTTMTLKENEHSSKLTEELLKTDFEWIYWNAHKYGFIIRYPNECAEHTGFDSKSNVRLRYVGVPHATYMFENGLCFEEYLELLRSKYTYSNPLTVSADGKTYEVYYAKYTGEPTAINVKKGGVAEISGDNMNGFIVTVE